MIYVISCHQRILKYFINKNDIEESCLITSTPQSESEVLNSVEQLAMFDKHSQERGL